MLHFGVPGVGKTREEAPLSALYATENTRSRPVQLFTKQFLGGLKAHADKSREDEGAAESREILRRMIDEELRAYVDVLRCVKAGKELGEEDRLTLRRVEDLYEKVRDELAAPH